MTLLEAVIAFVLLSVVGVVCLDQSRGASQLQARSAEWTRAVEQAESALAEATSRALPMANAAGRDAGRDAVRVDRRTWRPGVDVVSVTVPLAHGGEYVLERLAPSTAASMATR
jgi:Tfp pilus assembly protein PilV